MRHLKVKVIQTPEALTRQAVEYATAKPHEIALARLLMLAAFKGREGEKGAQAGLAIINTGPDFRPGPLYIAQAMKLFRYPALKAELKRIVEGLDE